MKVTRRLLATLAAGLALAGVSGLAGCSASPDGPGVATAVEPGATTTSSPKPGSGVLELLRDLNAAGATVVIVTHNGEVAAGCDRQIEMRDGRVLKETLGVAR